MTTYDIPASYVMAESNMCPVCGIREIWLHEELCHDCMDKIQEAEIRTSERKLTEQRIADWLEEVADKWSGSDFSNGLRECVETIRKGEM